MVPWQGPDRCTLTRRLPQMLHLPTRRRHPRGRRFASRMSPPATRAPSVLLLAALLVGLAGRGALGESSAGQAEPLGLAQALRHHAEALGGIERVSAFHSVHIRAHVTLIGMGVEGSSETWFEEPCRFAESIELGPLKQRAGHDGVRSWEVDFSGKTVVKTDSASLAEAEIACLLQGYAYLLCGNCLLEVGGPESVGWLGEGDFLVLRVRASLGGLAKIFIDAESWLPVGVETTQQGFIVRVRNSDFRDVDGLLLPFSAMQYVPAAGQTMRLEVESVELGVDAPDSVFLPPGQSEPLFRIEDPSGCVTVPCLSVSRLLAVRGNLGGEEGLFLLDTGAGGTVLDEGIAERLGLNVAMHLPVLGGGGTAKASLARMPELSVGAARVEGHLAAVLPLPETEPRIDGILGYGFLGNFTVFLDPCTRRVSFCDPDSVDERLILEKGYEPLVARLAMDLFAVEVLVEGRWKATMLLDTGAAATRFFRDFASQCGFYERPGSSLVVVGAAGAESSYVVTVQELAVGSSRLGNLPVHLQVQKEEALNLDTFDGLLGIDVLSHFECILDYRRQRVFLRSCTAEAAFGPDN